LSSDGKRKAIASGFVIAASKAGGNLQTFEEGRRIVSGVCPECAKKVSTKDIRGAMQRLVGDIQQAAVGGDAKLKSDSFRKQEMSTDTTTPLATPIGSPLFRYVLLPGIAILGGIFIAKKYKRKKKKGRRN